MTSDVLRIISIAVPKKGALIDLVLDCGHTVRRFDPGENFRHLRPKEVDCHKCRRNAPSDHPEGRA